MTQSPVEWHGFETSQSESSDQNGTYAALLSQQQQPNQMQQQYIQQMQQQLIQQQLMQQVHRVDQMMQPIFGINQTSLQHQQQQHQQQQRPILIGAYPTNGARPPNPQTANPPTYHTLEPASGLPTSLQLGRKNPPTPQPIPGGVSVVGAKSAAGAISGNVTAQPKRPMNAFMVWARSERGLMAKENPKKHNSEISKLLGLKWKEMTIDQKQPFLDEAKRMASQLLIDYPDYKYQPTKKNKKKLPAKNPLHPGSSAIVPPGGGSGQSPFSGSMFDFLQGQRPLHTSNDDMYAMNPGSFSGLQDMHASANIQNNYGSFGGLVGQSYPISSHNVIFQGYPPTSFGFNGMGPGYISQPQQSLIGGSQPRPSHHPSQMSRIKAETPSPENHMAYGQLNTSNTRVMMTQGAGETVSQHPDNSRIAMPSFLFVSGPQVSTVQSTPAVAVKNPYFSETSVSPLEDHQ